MCAGSVRRSRSPWSSDAVFCWRFVHKRNAALNSIPWVIWPQVCLPAPPIAYGHFFAVPGWRWLQPQKEKLFEDKILAQHHPRQGLEDGTQKQTPRFAQAACCDSEAPLPNAPCVQPTLMGSGKQYRVEKRYYSIISNNTRAPTCIIPVV